MAIFNSYVTNYQRVYFPNETTRPHQGLRCVGASLWTKELVGVCVDAVWNIHLETTGDREKTEENQWLMVNMWLIYC